MLKKSIALLTLLVILLTSFTACADIMYVYTRNGKPLNLRDQYIGTVLTRIPFGAKVYVDEEKSTEDTAFISYDVYEGFVSRSFLSKTEEQSPDTPGTLKQGSKGNAVTSLQKMLITLGFLDDTADGIFGQKTRVALDAYYQYTGWDTKSYATPLDITRLTKFHNRITGKTPFDPGVRTLRDLPSCVPENGYCYDHKELTYCWKQYNTKGTPAKMQKIIATHIRDTWLTAINRMYDEWATFDSKTAKAQKKIFQKAWKAQKAKDIHAQAAWLDATGVDLCYDLHGKTN